MFKWKLIEFCFNNMREKTFEQDKFLSIKTRKEKESEE